MRILAAILLALLPAVALAVPPLGIATRAKVMDITDGDTVVVEVRYRVQVRLKDVWAPEKNEPLGERATEALTLKAGGKNVVLHIPSADAKGLWSLMTFGRVVGVLYGSDGTNLNEAMVKGGYASSKKGLPLGK